MKKILIIVCFLLLGFSVCAQAKKQGDALAYSKDVVYQGQFNTAQLFNRYERVKIWIPSNRLNTLEKVSCLEARTDLQQNGIWLGNLDDDGQCADPGEAPEWATGNYLNFLSETSKARQAKQGKQTKETKSSK